MKSKTERHYWTDEDDNLIRQLYPNNYVIDVAKKMNLSVNQIYNRAFILGIKKSPEWMKSELKIQAERLKVIGVKGRFKPGQIPVNKGQKMSSEVYEKAKATMFKPGQKPKNTKWNGYERVTVDDYIQVRVSERKFKMKHKMIWEEANGKLPEGMIVVFKDKNRRNFAIENLEAITYAENMKRNTLSKYPSELKQLIKLNNKLKTQLKPKKNEK